MNRVAMLWHLQTIDQELDDNSKRAHQVEEALAADPVVTAARQALDTDQKRLAELKATLRSRELEAASLHAKIKGIENKLYAGGVYHPKELDSLEKDLEMHKRQRSTLDDQMLALMDSVEKTEAKVNDQQRTFDRAQEARSGNLERLEREKQELAARLTKLNADREQTRASLDAAAVQSYDHLRRVKAGRAMAQVRRDSCGTCGVAIPTGLVSRVRSGEEIVLCSGCGRILAA